MSNTLESQKRAAQLSEHQGVRHFGQVLSRVHFLPHL